MDLESRILTLENELRGLKALVGQSNPQILYNKVIESSFFNITAYADKAAATADGVAVGQFYTITSDPHRIRVMI